MKLGHVVRTLNVRHYASPPAVHHRTRHVESKMEEFEVITTGFGRLPGDDGRTIDVGPGSLLWYGSNELIEIFSDENEPYECIVFQFTVNGRPSPRPRRHSAWADLAAAKRFGESAVAQYRAGSADDRWLCPYLYATLYWHAMEHARNRAERGTLTAIERAMHFIEMQFREPISVEDIANAADRSASHLHALMRQQLGRSPMQVVQERRLEEARRLLVTTDLPIKQVQVRSGYSDATHFSRTFRARTGLSPSQYREQHII